jgi:hypothetical protein
MNETTELHVAETMHIEAEPQEPAPPAQGERELTPREKMMQTIAENREKQLNKELAEYEVLSGEAHDRATGQELGTTQTTREQEGAQEQPAPTQASPVAPAPEQPAVSRETPRRIVTVGQNQFNVTDAEYDHLAQIGALAQAAMAQQQHNPAVPPVQPAGPQREQPAPSPAAVPTFDEETARAQYRRIAFGTEEDGAKALQDLAAAIEARAAQRAPYIDPQQIRQAAVQEAVQTIELNHNLGVIGQEFPEIFNDRLRSQLAALQLHELRQRNAYFGRQQDNLSLYREACNNVRTAVGGSVQQPQSVGQAQPAPQAVLEPERIERKRAAPRNPSSTAARAALTETPTQQPNPSQVVEWMRRTRHQVPMN